MAFQWRLKISSSFTPTTLYLGAFYRQLWWCDAYLMQITENPFYCRGRRSYCWRVVVKGSCYYYLFLCLAARVKVERERRRHCGLTRRRRTTCILRQMPLEPIITKFVAAMVWIFLSWWERIQSDQIFKRGIMYLGDNSFSKRLFSKYLNVAHFKKKWSQCLPPPSKFVLLGKIIAC